MSQFSVFFFKLKDVGYVNITNIADLKVYLPACQPKHISLSAAAATVWPLLLRYSYNGQRGLKIPLPAIRESTLNTKVIKTMETCPHETIQCHGNKSVWHRNDSNEIWEVIELSQERKAHWIMTSSHANATPTIQFYQVSPSHKFQKMLYDGRICWNAGIINIVISLNRQQKLNAMFAHTSCMHAWICVY